MDNKKFTSQVTALILVNLMVKLIWIFFIERKVQISVGFESFGLYYSMFSVTLILGVINDPGLNNYLVQFLNRDKNNFTVRSQLFYVKTLLTGLYLFSTLVVAVSLGFDDYKLLLLLILYQILFSFLNYFRSFLKGYYLFKAEIFFSVLDKALVIVALLPILYFGNSFSWTVTFYLTAQLLAITLALIICIYYLYKKQIFVLGKQKDSFKLSDWQAVKHTLKQLAPFAVFAFLVLAYNKIDTVMLAKMLPNGNLQTGTYVGAYRFLDAASMLPILFATLLYPLLYKIAPDATKVGALLNNSLAALGPITITIAMASWFYRNALMAQLYGQNSSLELSLIFGLLMFSLPAVTIYYVFSSFFTANSNLNLLNSISAGGLAINIVLNFVLIPDYEALGAAISSLISFSLVAIAYVIFYHLKFKYPFPTWLWLKIFAFSLLLIILGYLIGGITQNWLLGFSSYLVTATILTIIFKFFDLKSIKNSINTKV